jgi:hypothetical protein
MAKRDSIRGRGADIFLTEEPVATPPTQVPPALPSQPVEQLKTVITPPPQEPVPAKHPIRDHARRQRRSKDETVKLTVYIQPTLDAQLDRLWLRRRMQDVSAQKSLLVEEALQLLFDREAAS